MAGSFACVGARAAQVPAPAPRTQLRILEEQAAICRRHARVTTKGWEPGWEACEGVKSAIIVERDKADRARMIELERERAKK